MHTERIVNLKELIGHYSYENLKDILNTQDKCLEMLSNAKWADGFVCRHCSNTRYCQGKTAYARRCTRCKRDESPTAHTIFHHCKIELPRAFEIAYLVCFTPSIPATELSQLLDTRHMTCLNFKKRILQCIQLDGKIIIDINI